VREIPSEGRRWLKAELHSHCSADPNDYRFCEYTPEQLIETAAHQGYDVLAITCHNLDVWSRGLAEYAESLGITLLPGMEVTVERGRHVLVYNFRTGCENVNTLAKIRARRREDTLVVAPHPFYPSGSCLNGLLRRNLDVFDALEVSGFHTRRIDFNAAARRFAERQDLPAVGNADVHRLWQLGRTWSWIYAEPGILPVLHAVRQGHVRVHSSPITLGEAASWWATCLWRAVFPVHASPRLGNRLFSPEG